MERRSSNSSSPRTTHSNASQNANRSDGPPREQPRADGEYLDVVAFIEVGQARKVKPRLCGYAKKSGGKLYVTLQTMPVPGAGWDGTLVIEKRTERTESND